MGKKGKTKLCLALLGHPVLSSDHTQWSLCFSTGNSWICCNLCQLTQFLGFMLDPFSVSRNELSVSCPVEKYIEFLQSTWM